MNQIPCPFRFDQRTSAKGEEVATCGLLKQLLRVVPDEACEVSRDACLACCESTPVGSSFVNAVFPSIGHQVTSELLSQGTDCEQIQFLHSVFERAVINEDALGKGKLATCDVFLPCRDAGTVTRESIESVLNQVSAVVNLHLILIAPEAENLKETYGEKWNVHWHPANGRGFHQAIHELMPNVCSEFVALQDPNCVALPQRISNAISELLQRGADFAGAILKDPSGELPSVAPEPKLSHSIHSATLVMRKSAYIDLGGFADRPVDFVEELLCRARHQEHRMVIIPVCSVESKKCWQVPNLGPPPIYESKFRSLRHCGIGYPTTARVSCDVVAPVYKHLDLASLAIESAIEQENADVLVHVVDDCSPEDTTGLFSRWKSHPQVRLYRNKHNIGQYASFNNISDFFETDFVAVQDGDDVSFPHRLSSSINFLNLCQAEFFAGGVEVFGNQDLIDERFKGDNYRKSLQPRGRKVPYFALNPTACFRTEMFRRLGGYSDFGGSKYKAGFDSEFMQRAYYAGVRFAISTQIVTRYRLHGESATQNPTTGFGSEKRLIVQSEAARREELCRRNSLDPKVFGAIGRYRGVTERIH